MFTFVKRLLFALSLLLLAVLVYQNLQPLSQKTQFRLSLSWVTPQESTPESGAADTTSQGGAVEGNADYITPEIPNLLLFLACLILGMLLAGFHGVYERMARRFDIRKRDKHIRALEKELGEYKAQVAELKAPAPPAEPAPEPEKQPPDQLEPPRGATGPEDAPTL
jgi:uncharacterized integral membrane protein